MTLKQVVAVAAFATASALAISRADLARPHVYHYENVMGTSMDIVILAVSERVADTAAAAALAQIDRDSRILSSYDAGSEFSQWSRTRDVPQRVSPELFDVLELFDRWRTRTGGAVDPSAERLTRLWRTAATRQILPSDHDLAAATGDVKRPHWRLDPVGRTATHLDETPLALNSFTKSYVIERAVRAALDSGRVRAAVINVGGDVVSRGRWSEPVAVLDPMDNADNAAPMTRLSIADRAVATSGSYRRGFDIGGRHYSHIVDPRTGRPADEVISATVVADSGVEAGALATAFCVLRPDESARLAAQAPGVEYLLVLAGGRRIESAGWRRLEIAPRAPLGVPSPVARLFASEQTWNTDYELSVSLEIAQPDGGRARRPYVAIWIEDKDKVPVRTVALLFNKYRYLPELRAWSRVDRQRVLAGGKEIVDVVSSATRAPGRYTFKWDGRDQQGQLVKPGRYTVWIEASREHGTYQVIHQEMDFSGVPKQIELPGNVEISAAALDYRKVSVGR